MLQVGGCVQLQMTIHLNGISGTTKVEIFKIVSSLKEDWLNKFIFVKYKENSFNQTAIYSFTQVLRIIYYVNI